MGREVGRGVVTDEVEAMVRILERTDSGFLVQSAILDEGGVWTMNGRCWLNGSDGLS